MRPDWLDGEDARQEKPEPTPKYQKTISLHFSEYVFLALSAQALDGLFNIICGRRGPSM
jgi:hypothetical protein